MPTAVPQYVSALLTARPNKRRGRNVWGIDLETVWIPFLTATNVTKATAIPSEDLGAPIKLARGKDGSVRFNETSGMPVYQVAKTIQTQVATVKENFTVQLLSFAGKVQREDKQGYAAEVAAAHEAGQPVKSKDAEDLELALMERAENVETKTVETGAPAPIPVETPA